MPLTSAEQYLQNFRRNLSPSSLWRCGVWTEDLPQVLRHGAHAVLKSFPRRSCLNFLQRSNTRVLWHHSSQHIYWGKSFRARGSISLLIFKVPQYSAVLAGMNWKPEDHNRLSYSNPFCWPPWSHFLSACCFHLLQEPPSNAKYVGRSGLEAPCGPKDVCRADTGFRVTSQQECP